MRPDMKTPEALKSGSAATTAKRTTFQIATPMIEILIGGPYTRHGETRTYGHMALRVVTSTSQFIYDFGRYGETRGQYSSEGEGILRVWSNFETYISSENSHGRITKGFVYPVSEQISEKIVAHYSRITDGVAIRPPRYPNQKEYKLPRDYHAVDNNCVTMALSGAKIALPLIDENRKIYSVGRGLSDVELAATKITNFGWPKHIFMPLDVQAMLENERRYTPAKINSYGGGK
jgi:hypothetical protein